MCVCVLRVCVCVTCVCGYVCVCVLVFVYVVCTYICLMCTRVVNLLSGYPDANTLRIFYK